MIIWSDDYSVGISVIDQQHKKLCSMVNELSESMTQGKGRDALGKIFNELVDYTATHFADEEKLMEQNGYPEFEEHKRKHDAMAGKVIQLREQYQENQSGLSIKTMDFLTGWLNKHIKETDKQYGPYLNSKGVR